MRDGSSERSTRESPNSNVRVDPITFSVSAPLDCSRRFKRYALVALFALEMPQHGLLILSYQRRPNLSERLCIMSYAKVQKLCDRIDSRNHRLGTNSQWLWVLSFLHVGINHCV